MVRRSRGTMVGALVTVLTALGSKLPGREEAKKTCLMFALFIVCSRLVKCGPLKRL